MLWQTKKQATHEHTNNLNLYVTSFPYMCIISKGEKEFITRSTKALLTKYLLHGAENDTRS